MRILALDTALAACSTVLWEDGRIRARSYHEMARGQAEVLLPAVVRAMSEAGADFDGLDLIAATLGPGSFTGLRVGLAAARGLALAARCPLVGVTTFEAVAEAIPATEAAGRSVLVAFDTRRRDLYIQLFLAGDAGGPNPMAPAGPARVIAPAALAGVLPVGPVLLAGDGAGHALAAFGEAAGRFSVSSSPPRPDAAQVAVVAARRSRGEIPPLPALPIYLRPPAVKPAGLARHPSR